MLATRGLGQRKQAELQAVANTQSRDINTIFLGLYGAEPVLQPYLQSGELKIVVKDWASMGAGFHAYYSGRRQVPTGLRLLIDLIREVRPLGL